MPKRLISIVVLSLVLTATIGSLPALAQDATPGASPIAVEGQIPVIIDSDMTVDDWMATLYVLNDAQFDVKAITVSGTGFAAGCNAGIRAAVGLLALAEYGDVPVSCGPETPLLGDNAPPTEWRTTVEMVESFGLPEGGEPVSQDAIALFTSTIQNSPEPATVLALGPLTNIGAALEATPELVDNIAMIYFMGGAVDVAGSGIGEANTTAEWNVYCDPHGARLVFESGVPITMIPLDATNAVPITPDFVAGQESGASTPVAEFVARLLADVAETFESGSYYFWDPLAAVVMADPGIVTLTPRTVTVIVQPGDPEDGRTMPADDGVEVLVATEPDAAALETALIENWNA